MKIVYVLQSLKDAKRYYIGSTDSLTPRIVEHNAGSSIHHTAKHRPWRLIVSVHFDDSLRAFAFERYLKTGSGRSFAKRHF
jgi:predicted GIY-YIG superfamily endonuclease